MKIARTIGLAALAAMALMASVGVGSAAAVETTLCKTSAESPFCASKDRYATGTVVQATSTNATIDGGSFLGIINCSESTLEGTTGAAAGEPLAISVSAWTVGGCTNTTQGKSCTVKPNEGAPFAGSLAWTGSSNGGLTISNAGSGEPGWRLTCGFIINCMMSFSSTLDVSGGAPAAIVANAEPASAKTGVCPEKPTFSATYTVKSPSAAYLAQGGSPVRLCKVKETGGGCKSSDLYPVGTVIKAKSTDFKIMTNIGNITCGEASTEAETLALGASPYPLKMLSFNLGNCQWPGMGGTCSVYTSNLSTAEIYPGIGEYDELVIPTLSWYLQCGATYSCTLKMNPGMRAQLYETSAKGKASFSYTGSQLSRGSCLPDVNLLYGTFTVSAPDPLYVAT